MNPPRSVAVVGAGIAGLTAARRLARSGVDVTVWEAADRVGGQVHSVDVAPGLRLDVGAESLHLGAPGVRELVEEAGLTGDRAPVAAAALSSRLLTRHGLRPVPAGVGPSGPTRLTPVLRSLTLGPVALARAGLEPFAARRTGPLAEGGDVSVGDFVSDRFGRGVASTLVEPMLGTLHAGDVDRLSLRACAPMLVPAATSGRSLLRRRRGPAPSMSFVTWPAGLATLTDALASDVPGMEVRTGEPVTGLRREADGTFAVLTAGGVARVDAVVLAVPPRSADALVWGVAPSASLELGGVDCADVATVLVALPRAAADALRGTGVLLPASSGHLLKAATYLSRKWPHLAGGDDFWVRLSAGRDGDLRLARTHDDALVERLLAELAAVTRVAPELLGEPRTAVVRRWTAAMPQLTVGHGARMARARSVLPPGLALAGAAYDGVGLAAAARSGRAAADELLGDPTARRSA